MIRPVLGVIACTRSVGPEQAQSVINRYATAAMRYADAAALIIPNLGELMTAREVAPRIDGLFLTGSPSNVQPALYGQDGADGPFDPGRDAMTLDLIDAMLEQGKPVFGVCRGLQEINVAFGGTLRRDTGRAADLIAHHAPDDAAFDAMFAHEHEVTLTPAGVLAQAFGQDRMRVSSVHYQGIDRLGDGLSVEATAPDGLVEGVSAWIDGAPVVAVQWHPEWRVQDNPQSQDFFRLLGRALRGELAPPKVRIPA
jgi:putative glutamine amidotransferase